MDNGYSVHVAHNYYVLYMKDNKWQVYQPSVTSLAVMSYSAASQVKNILANVGIESRIVELV